MIRQNPSVDVGTDPKGDLIVPRSSPFDPLVNLRFVVLGFNLHWCRFDQKSVNRRKKKNNI